MFYQLHTDHKVDPVQGAQNRVKDDLCQLTVAVSLPKSAIVFEQRSCGYLWTSQIFYVEQVNVMKKACRKERISVVVTYLCMDGEGHWASVVTEHYSSVKDILFKAND